MTTTVPGTMTPRAPMAEAECVYHLRLLTQLAPIQTITDATGDVPRVYTVRLADVVAYIDTLHARAVAAEMDNAALRVLVADRDALKIECDTWRSTVEPDGDVPYTVFVSRQLLRGASYDGERGVWWTSTDKPGIVRALETERDDLRQALEQLKQQLNEP